MANVLKHTVLYIAYKVSELY